MCRCSLCQYQTEQRQKLDIAFLFAKTLDGERWITQPKLVVMTESLQHIFGFGFKIDTLQYPILARKDDFEGALSGEPSEEAFLSYITSRADICQLFVGTYEEREQFAKAAKYRADYYVISVEANVLLSTLVGLALNVAILCILGRTGGIGHETTLAWIKEVKKKLTDLYLNDERLWDVLVDPLLKNVKALARSLS